MANEAAFPASFCETLGWIGDWPLGSAFGERGGTATEPSPIAMFLVQFAGIVRHLEGGHVSLSGDLSPDEARRAAQKRTCQLIVQFHEVPAGWEEEFTVNLPGIEPFVAFPSRPIRTANEALEFMAEKGKQASLNNWFTPKELRERALRDAIRGAVLWLVDYGHAKPSILSRELPTDLLELHNGFADVRAQVKGIWTIEQGRRTQGKADRAVQTGAALQRTDVPLPSSLAEFATWIDSLLTELEGREGDEPIGESGKAHMPLASPVGSPAVSVVTLHQPSRLYVIREQLWDGLEKLVPPNVVDELFAKHPPEKVKTLRYLRRLIVASKSAVADIGGAPLTVTREQMSWLVGGKPALGTIENKMRDDEKSPKAVSIGIPHKFTYSELVAWFKTDKAFPAVICPDETKARSELLDRQVSNRGG